MMAQRGGRDVRAESNLRSAKFTPDRQAHALQTGTVPPYQRGRQNSNHTSRVCVSQTLRTWHPTLRVLTVYKFKPLSLIVPVRTSPQTNQPPTTTQYRRSTHRLLIIILLNSPR